MLVGELLSRRKPFFGEVLVALGRISYTQLDEALGAQKSENRYLGEILADREWITAQDIADALQVQEEYERRRGVGDIYDAASRAAAIEDIVLSISAGKPLDSVLLQIVLHVRSALGFDRAGIFLVNQDTREAEGAWGTSEQGHIENIRHLKYSLDAKDGFGGIYHTGEPFYTADAAALWRTSNVRHHAIVPMRSAEKTIGFIAVDNLLTNRPFGTEAIPPLQVFASGAALAVEQAHLSQELKTSHEQSQRRTEQLESLNLISRAMASEVTLDRRLQRFYEETVKIIPAERFVVRVEDATSRQVQTLIMVDDGVRHEREPFSLTPETLYWKVRETGKPIMVADLPDAERQRAGYRPISGKREVRSLLLAPMIYENTVTGLVGAYSSAANAYNQEHVDLLAAIADRAAVALRNARLYARAQEQLQELSVLYQVSKSVSRGASTVELAEQVTKLLPSIIPCDGVGLILVDEQTGEWRSVGHGGSAPRAFQATDLVPKRGIVGRVIQTGKSVLAGDVGRVPFYFAVREATRSELCVPLKIGDRVIGALNFESNEINQFRPHHEQLANTAATNIAVLIENSRLIEKLKQANQELTSMQAHLIQVEKLRALGEMASGIAHDFNNALASVVGFTELLLLRKDLDAKIRDYLMKIQTSASTASATVRRMQDFARQKPEPSLEPVNINELVNDVIALTRHKWHDQAIGQGVTVRMNTALTAGKTVNGNSTELTEVLTNLIFNAVDAMPTGGTITIQTSDNGHPDNGAPATVTISVLDTGIGMDETVQARIFDPFFTTKGVQGNGLGLSVCYGIVQRHRGRILVESQPGNGSKFVVSLPAGS